MSCGLGAQSGVSPAWLKAHQVNPRGGTPGPPGSADSELRCLGTAPRVPKAIVRAPSLRTGPAVAPFLHVPPRPPPGLPSGHLGLAPPRQQLAPWTPPRGWGEKDRFLVGLLVFGDHTVPTTSSMSWCLSVLGVQARAPDLWLPAEMPPKLHLGPGTPDPEFHPVAKGQAVFYSVGHNF